MVQCPSCNHQIDQEFGMVTCSECHAVFMIDFSGNIEFGEAESKEESPQEFEGPLSDESQNISETDNYEMQSQYDSEAYEDQIVEPESAPGFNTEELQGYDQEIVDSSELIEEVSSEGIEEEPSEEIDEEPFEEIEREPVPVAITVPVADPDPVDISEFANSEESSLDDGLYLYDLSIDRIDSKELKETIKYVLGDDKLKLDVNEIMATINNGQLSMVDLHPLKAKRIVEQLQYYDFDIRWQQRLVVLEAEATEMGMEDEY